MRSTFLTLFLLAAGALSAPAQDHGSLMYGGKTIPLTAYRTRTTGAKRWVIADGKADGRLYSVTVTLRPDVTQASVIKTDDVHSATLTISNTDYTKAENHCFDGGSTLQVTPGKGGLTVSGQEMVAGDCFGKTKAGGRLTFTMKP